MQEKKGIVAAYHFIAAIVEMDHEIDVWVITRPMRPDCGMLDNGEQKHWLFYH